MKISLQKIGFCNSAPTTQKFKILSIEKFSKNKIKIILKKLETFVIRQRFINVIVLETLQAIDVIQKLVFKIQNVS